MNLTVETWPVDKIIPYDKNAKLHHVEWIAKSISEFSIDQPIVVDGQGVIIKGHGRLKAAKSLGLTEFPVVVRTDLTPEQIRLARIADNRSAEGGWDSALLGEELNALLSSMPDYDFDALGLSEDWFSSLDVTLDTAPAYDDAALDNVPELNEEEPITKLGDLWQLGNHRLLCGDATKREDVERLLNGEKADMVFTDPPYGVKVVSKSGKVGGENICETGTYKQIIGDDTTKTAEKTYFLITSFHIRKQIIWGGNYFTHFLPPKACWIVWDKKGEMESNNFADGEVAWTNFDTPLRIYRNIWRGMIKEGENQKRIHPTQKPVNLCQSIIHDFDGQSVMDLFGGSGSTLIACEKLNRQCLMMELDPHYCDVIVKRWETLTGNHAVLL